MWSSQFAPPSGALARDGTLTQSKFPQAVRSTMLIDSRDRNYTVYPNSSQFVVELPEVLKNVVNAVLVCAEMPLSYYVFSASRNNTTLEFSAGATPYTATIPDGNYTTAQMAAALKLAMDTASGSTFTVTIDPVTMKTNITNASAVFSVDTTGTTKTADWGLGYYLGLPRDVVLGSSVVSGTNTVVGTNVVSLNPENYLLIDIEELNGLQQTSPITTRVTTDPYSGKTISQEDAGSGRKVFAKVTLDNNNYQYNFYDRALTYVEIRPQVTKLERLRVSVRFHDGTLVDFNGGEWSMSLEFACTLTRGL